MEIRLLKKKTVTETKKVVNNPSLNDYIDWCNNNFKVINSYKKKKRKLNMIKIKHHLLKVKLSR